MLLAAVGWVSAATSAFAQDQDPARSLAAAFRQAAKRVAPAVVTIRPAEASGAFRVEGPIVPRVFGEFPAPAEAADATGLVLDAEKGLVLTCDHAVGPGDVRVVLPDGRERVASKVARDPRSDLALLTIDPEGLDGSAEWGDSKALEAGDWVLAVGQAYGFEKSVSAGIVSGLGRTLGVGASDLIQTDAALHPGSSGGPLVDLDGRVVGICVAVRGPAIGGGGMGFAIPSERARRVAGELAEHGRVRRAYLGVRIEDPSPDRIAAEGRRPGVRLGVVVQPGPAAEAGLVPGDVILRVDDRPVSSTAELQAAVEFAPIGEPLALTIRRDDAEREVQVTPTELPGPEPAVIVPAIPGRRLRPRFEVLPRREP
jgi:serine protease Do